jgi:Domain of unknown function (DUF1972)/Glycosyl transferases group 1
MKIAFLGTKGIPNNYGGFEQFAEYLSVLLAARGHSVTVYNPSFHPFEQKEFKSVRIERIYSPEKLIGGAANFLYDHLCLQHALKQDYDIIYEAGYHSVALSYKLLGIRRLTKPVIITNMDGLEWKRSKWSFGTRQLIKQLEKIAVKESPYLISDNEGIRQYYLDEFKRDSFFVPYGADPIVDFDSTYLDKYEIKPNEYFMLMARMEPENNIELILEGYVASGNQSPFIVIGGYGNKFGERMFQKYSSKVRFIGGVYNKSELDSLRYFSTAYFHGHSVGGTNPSLLEAMACQSLIVSHNNAFNKGVLGDDAIYFSDKSELVTCFQIIDESRVDTVGYKARNFEKIKSIYNWENITIRHEELFRSLIGRD